MGLVGGSKICTNNQSLYYVTMMYPEFFCIEFRQHRGFVRYFVAGQTGWLAGIKIVNEIRVQCLGHFKNRQP